MSIRDQALENARKLRLESFVANGGDPDAFEQWESLLVTSEFVGNMWANGLVDRIPRGYLRRDHVQKILKVIGLRE